MKRECSAFAPMAYPLCCDRPTGHQGSHHATVGRDTVNWRRTPNGGLTIHDSVICGLPDEANR